MADVHAQAELRAIRRVLSLPSQMPTFSHQGHLPNAPNAVVHRQNLVAKPLETRHLSPLQGGRARSKKFAKIELDAGRKGIA
ncbi:MAG TPA: hypothetical protein VH558_18480 [Pseudolabrys sp.]|jgi:hypothetical protein